MGDWTAADFALARRDWSQAPASDEMDRAVLRLIVAGGDLLDLHPSRDITAAFTFLNVLTATAFVQPEAHVAGVTLTCDMGDRAPAQWWRCRLDGVGWWSEGHGDTPMLAICRALLDYESEEQP